MSSFPLALPRSLPLFSGEIPRAALMVTALLFALRVATSNLTAPLWLDENFSAAIAAQPTLHGLVDWCLNELSGPLYYSTLWAWQKLAGSGDTALRVPGLVFEVMTPAFLLWRGHRDREVRIAWALAVGLWPFGFDLAAQARPYAAMLFLGCVQAVCFLRLIEAPTTRRAAIWAGISALAVLTHYHAAVISGVEGVLYLASWRGRALRTWPAAFMLVPMAAWMSWHLRLVLGYATSGQTWYQLLTWREALVVPVVLCGSIVMAAAVVLLATLALRAEGRRLLRWTPELTVIAAGVIATVLVVGMGFVRPSFSIRYLLPYIGALALLLPILVRAVRPTVPAAPLAVVLLLIGASLSPLVHRLTAPRGEQRSFNFEQPSNWIMQQGGMRRVVFEWDNPTALLGHPDKLADVGGFFFRRAGHPVEVLIPRYALGADPWPAVKALAADRADTALIWSFDRDVPMTSALTHPVGALADRARWTCRDFGPDRITVLACVPRRDAR